MQANEYFFFLSLAEVSSWQEVLKKSIMKFDSVSFLRNMRMYNFGIERMRWKNKGRKLFSKQAWYHFSITRKKINLAKCIYNASFIIFVLDINNYSHTQPHVLIAQFTCSEIIGHRKCHMENWRLIRFVLPPFHMKHKNIFSNWWL